MVTAILLNAPRAFHSKRFNLEMNAGGVLFFQDSRTCVSRESWPYLGTFFQNFLRRSLFNPPGYRVWF